LLLAAAGGGWYVFARANRDAIEQAKAAFQKCDGRTAGLELRNAVCEQSANAEAHALLSQLQIAQGDPVAAEKEIKRAAELGWPKQEPDQVLAHAYLEQSKWKEIRSEIPRSGPTPVVTSYYVMVHASAERALHDMPAAKATMAQAEKADPANWSQPRRLDIQVITALSLRLDLQTDRARLDQTAATLKPRLLILDPFVRLHRIDKNVSGDVAPLLALSARPSGSARHSRGTRPPRQKGHQNRSRRPGPVRMIGVPRLGRFQPLSPPRQR
jgi:hypothetical protein